jgi:hypothetical protein
MEIVGTSYRLGLRATINRRLYTSTRFGCRTHASARAELQLAQAGEHQLAKQERESTSIENATTAAPLSFDRPPMARSEVSD